MSNSQKRALANYRQRLAEQGIARFEVMGLERDRDLIRSLAKQLSAGGVQANRLRTEMESRLKDDARPKGGVLAALRQSPLVGVDLDLARERDEGRTVDL